MPQIRQPSDSYESIDLVDETSKIGNALIIVHANNKHDPDEISRNSIQAIIDANFEKRIYEYKAFNQSFIHHDGKVIDQDKTPGVYDISDLVGNNIILVGGMLGHCHYRAFMYLVHRAVGPTSFHLPLDAIYTSFLDYDYESNRGIPKSINPDFNRVELVKYSDLVQSLFGKFDRIGPGFRVNCDGDFSACSKQVVLQLNLWSSSNLMLRNMK